MRILKMTEVKQKKTKKIKITKEDLVDLQKPDPTPDEIEKECKIIILDYDRIIGGNLIKNLMEVFKENFVYKYIMDDYERKVKFWIHQIKRKI